MDLISLLWLLELIGSIMAAIGGFIAFLFSVFIALGLSHLHSSFLVGIVFLTGFYVLFMLLKVVTKLMIFVLTLGFVGLVLVAAVGFI